MKLAQTTSDDKDRQSGSESEDDENDNDNNPPNFSQGIQVKFPNLASLNNATFYAFVSIKFTSCFISYCPIEFILFLVKIIYFD